MLSALRVALATALLSWGAVLACPLDAGAADG